MTPLLVFTLLAQSAFLTEPYLQLGNRPMPATGANEFVTVVWHAADRDQAWNVEARQGRGNWRAAAKIETRRVAVRGVTPFRIHEAEVDGLAPGVEFEYRVRLAGKEVFAASGLPRGRWNAKTKFALLGDTGINSAGERRVVEQIWKAKPDAVLIAGDIVYEHGRMSEYARNFYPVFNSKDAPLMRSHLVIAAPGNHDLEEGQNLGSMPDGLAYFNFWSPPQNGPKGAGITPVGPRADQDAFLQAAGDRFPGIANFSFDWGPTHWTILDSSAYVDWTRKELRDWLVNDLKSAGPAWKFVLFHHAPFHSSRKHAEQQRMRLLAETFEQNDVKVIFAGHVHNYQRTHRIKFKPSRPGYGRDQRVPGTVTKDENGVTYIVSGAGGAGLHDRYFTGKPKEWQDFTAVFEAVHHSFTLIEAEEHKVLIRQVGSDGRELDRFELTR